MKVAVAGPVGAFLEIDEGKPLERSQIAKALLGELFRGLRPEDRFNLMFFSGGSRLLSPRSLPATPENLERALALGGAIGGAVGGAALELLGVERAAYQL